MKRIVCCAAAVIAMIAGAACAEEFHPTLLKVGGRPYFRIFPLTDTVEIPVTVTGTSARVVFSLFTKDKADKICQNTNGYLGWHYVNKIDTCVYCSQSYDFDIGENIITWDCRDQDGNYVPYGDYYYYLWAYDHKSEAQLVTRHMYAGKAFDYTTAIRELDVDGLPLAHPILYTADERWLIGSDPDDEAGKLTTLITLEDGWRLRGDPALDPYDLDNFFVSVTDSAHGSIQKLRFVPGGEAEIAADWGEEAPYASTYRSFGGESAGVVSDRNYLYTTDAALEEQHRISSAFYMYDMDGYMVIDVDISEWWSSQRDYTASGILNAGPVNFTECGGRIVLNSHASCLTQMIDPVRYLETEELEDLIVWSNGNGDYTGDKNFAETAQSPWICNDEKNEVFKYSIAADVHHFSVFNACGIGAVSFGLFLPDGTGAGYFSFFGDSPEDNYGVQIIDGETPYDGMYCDRWVYKQAPEKANHSLPSPDGLGFVGYDSFWGVISIGPCDVEEDAAAPITLSPNTPNPFNPATTIPFTLPEEARLSLTVYDVTGKKVAVLADGVFSAGSHNVTWDASGCASGVYFCRMKTGDFERTGKMTLVK